MFKLALFIGLSWNTQNLEMIDNSTVKLILKQHTYIVILICLNIRMLNLLKFSVYEFITSSYSSWFEEFLIEDL